MVRTLPHAIKMDKQAIRIRKYIDTQRHLVYKCPLNCTLYTYTYAKYTIVILRTLAFVIIKKSGKSTRKVAVGCLNSRCVHEVHQRQYIRMDEKDQ